MPVKESSDELNAPMITADAVTTSPTPKRSIGDYIALAIATCGVGYLPLAPGTWGSLLAIAFYLFLFNQWFSRTDIPRGMYARTFLITQLIVLALVTVVGIWAASRTERVLKIKDPGRVVIDEVAGQLIPLLLLPARLWRNTDMLALIAAFILFRFFDIVKPYPARKLESLRGGWGIMADDLIAGVYAAIGVELLLFLLR